MDENNNNTIREKVLEKIKREHIAMRPRWHFIFIAALAMISILIAVLAILYFASFTIFSLRQTGALFIPLFGLRGWLVFFTSFPWMLLLIVVLCAVLLELLMRHYAWNYRHSILTRSIGILLLALVGGILIYFTPLHRELFRHARDNDLPLGGGLYHDFGERSLPDVVRGRIISMNKDGFIMLDAASTSLRVVIGPMTHLPFGSDFDQGGTVIVFGRSVNGTIFAEGIREISD